MDYSCTQDEINFVSLRILQQSDLLIFKNIHVSHISHFRVLLCTLSCTYLLYFHSTMLVNLTRGRYSRPIVLHPFVFSN